MTAAPLGGKPGALEPAHDLRRLDRDALVALVEALRAENDRQRAVIARQAAAIADLRRRSPAPPDDSSAAADGSSPRRPTAKPVPGYDYTLVFDGGSLGNPGQGYGSYQIVGKDGLVEERTLDFGGGVTNNQAEFRTLIAALEGLRRRLGDEASRTDLAVRGDSQLVVNTVTGRWKARHPELQPLRERAAALLGEFGRTDVAWQRRGASVRVLGH